LYQGDTSGAVVNLTGYTAKLEVKDVGASLYAQPSTSKLLTLTENSGITLGGSAGTITVLQSAAQTTAYTWATGEYRLTLTAPGGDTNVYLYGDVTVERF
jgi:hypothetical protein